MPSEMIGLHYPICGGPISVAASGNWWCVAGDMEITQALRQALTDCYLIGTREPKRPNVGIGAIRSGIGGQWHCPGCGIEVVEAPLGVLTCGRCDRSLNEFVYALVEFHFHKRLG